MKNKFTPAFWLALSMIIVASAIRIIANELNLWNFSPVAAVALFAGVRFTDKKFAFIIPISIMLLTDLIIGFNTYMFPVYLALALTTCLGIMISKKENVLNVTIASLCGSAIFFIITNLVFWYDTSLYPHTIAGQWQSFIAAIPFTRNTIFSDLLFNGALFGGWYLIQKSNPKIAQV